VLATLHAVYPSVDFKLGSLKEFLVSFAKTAEFDPFVPDNWYSVTAQDIIDKVFNKNSKINKHL
jgi:hypothetical protein